MIVYIGVVVAALFARITEKTLRKKYPEKYHKYYGFLFGLNFSYVLLLSIYVHVFDWDFSFWHYITPMNVLVLGLVIAIGYGSYMDVINSKRSHILDGILLSVLFIICYGVICAKLEDWFGWNLHFLFFPWHH